MQPSNDYTYHDRQTPPNNPYRRCPDTSSGRWWAQTPNATTALSLSLAASLLAGGATQGYADDALTTASDEKKLGPWEKGYLRFGGFISAFSSDLGFGLNNGPSVEVKGEDGLGLDSSLTVLRLDAAYRIGKSRRHQLDFTYAAYHRKGSETLTEDMDLGDQTIPVGADINTVFNFDIIRTTYTYAFLQDDRMRIGMGLGVYVVPLEYELGVRTSGGRSEIEGADITLPLPALALRAEFLLVPKVFLNMEANFMYLQIGDFKGSLLDNTLGVEYRPWKHVGFGLAYSGMAVAVESETDTDYPGSDFIGSVDVKFNGLFLYGKVSF